MEASRQNAALRNLSTGEGRGMVGRVNELQQQKLAAAIKKTSEMEFAAEQARQQQCVG